MAVEMFYDDDADLSVIQGRKVAATEDGSSRPNGLDEKFRVASKR